MAFLVERAANRHLGPVATGEHDQLGALAVDLREDAPGRVVVGQALVDLGDQAHQLLRGRALAYGLQAMVDLGHILALDPADDRRAAVLEPVEMNPMLPAQQLGEVGHVFGQLRHRDVRGRVGVDAEPEPALVAHGLCPCPSPAPSCYRVAGHIARGFSGAGRTPSCDAAAR